MSSALPRRTSTYVQLLDKAEIWLNSCAQAAGKASGSTLNVGPVFATRGRCGSRQMDMGASFI